MLNLFIGAVLGSLSTLVLVSCLTVSARENYHEELYQSYWQGYRAHERLIKEKRA